VPQCGYCRAGTIMAVAALLEHKPSPSDADIDADIDAEITNICRCGTYGRVRKGIKLAAAGGGDGTRARCLGSDPPGRDRGDPHRALGDGAR